MSADGPGWQVEPVAAGDLDDVARLEQACLPDPWSVDDLRLYFGSGAIAAWRLVSGSAPQRAAAYAVFQLQPGEAELLRLGVAPEVRRRGFARLLLVACLERLAAGGRPVCHLEVRAGNEPARALYERLGFVLCGRRRAYYSNGDDAVRYRRAQRPAGG